MPSDVNYRRATRQKKARRKRLRTAFVLFIIIAIITLIIMCFTVFFPIQRIKVSGSKIYSNSQIIKASKITTDDNLFVVSEDKIKENIRKELPYIDDVKLKRVLPGAVSLTVTDAKESMYYYIDGQYVVLSESGYILKKQDEMPQNVFEIVTSGISGNVSELANYKNGAEQELIQTIGASVEKYNINIDKIDVSNILQISLEVEGKYTVVLGNTDYTQEKIAHLSSMIESIGDRSGKINLSMWTPQNSQGSFVEDKS